MRQNNSQTMEKGLVVGASAGAIIGEAVSLYVVYHLQWTRFVDCLLLNLLLVFVYSVAGIAIGLLLGHFVNRMKSAILVRPQNETALVASLLVFLLVLLYGLVLSPHRVFNICYSRYPFVDKFTMMALWSVGRAVLISLPALLIASGVNHLVRSSGKKRIRPRRRRKGFNWRSWVLPALFPALLIAFWVNNNVRQAARLRAAQDAPRLKVTGTTSPVMMVIWDGAEWSVLESMLQKGELPNLSSLTGRGIRIPVAHPGQTSPAMVWAEALTGLPSSRNGVLGANAWKIPLMQSSLFCPPCPGGLGAFLRFLELVRVADSRPANVTDRSVPVIWELASEAGVKVGVCGGYSTWPVREVGGYLVSRNAFEHVRQSMTQEQGAPESLAGDVFPPALSSVLAEEYNSALQAGSETLQRLTGYSHEAWRVVEASPVEEQAGALNTLRQAAVRDRFYFQLGRRLWQERRPDFSVFSYTGSDEVTQHLWHYRQPENYFSVPEEEQEIFGQSIEQYYSWMDEQLGRLIEDATGEYNLMVVSPYGQGPLFLSPDGRSAEHCAGREGFCVMAGPAVQTVSGELSVKMSIQDLAPTVLYLLGLPVAEDLPGRIINEAIAREFYKNNPPQTVPSFRPPPAVSADGRVALAHYRRD